MSVVSFAHKVMIDLNFKKTFIYIVLNVSGKKLIDGAYVYSYNQ